LRAFLEKHFTTGTPLVLCGDFNVARDELDVANPAAWEESVLFHPTSRAALEELLSWGLVDVHRQQHPEGGLYSWWDYRMLAAPRTASEPPGTVGSGHRKFRQPRRNYDRSPGRGSTSLDTEEIQARRGEHAAASHTTDSAGYRFR
jgi:hypothetical protein